MHDLLKLPVPATLNSFFSAAVYEYDPSAFREAAIDIGWDRNTNRPKLNTNSGPRAFVSFAATNVHSLERAIDVLRSNWDSDRTVLVERNVNLPERSDFAPEPVKAKYFTENELAFEIESKANGILVLAEAWYPGWKAEGKGKTVEGFAANGWMRGFAVSSGRNELRIAFHQNYLGVGFCLTAVGLAMLFLAHVRPVKKASE
jgi:hypothetical protein